MELPLITQKKLIFDQYMEFFKVLTRMDTQTMEIKEKEQQ